MMTNPFEQYADSQRSAHSKKTELDAARRAARLVVSSDADAPMKPNAMEEARDKRDAQVAQYRRAKKKEIEEVMQGPHGVEIKALDIFLKNLTIDNAGELVEYVMSSGWVKTADRDTRYAVLSLIGNAILKLRERNGLAPFDDPIGDQPPNAFLILRKGIMGV